MENRFNDTKYVLLIFLFFLIIFSISNINAVDPDFNTTNETAIASNDNNTLSVENSTDLMVVSESEDNFIDENKSSDEAKSTVESKSVNKLSEDNKTIKGDISTSLSAPSTISMKYHDGTQLIVRINCNESLDGKYLKMILDNNETYWRPINNNQANLTIYSYVGRHNIYCEFSYFGYTMSSCNVVITVEDNRIETILTADDLEMYYQDGSSYIVYLRDINGTKIANTYVTINIFNKNVNRTYFATTDNEGVAYVIISFGSGEYNVFTTFRGNNDYKSSNMTSKITIKKYVTSLSSEGITKYYGEDKNLSAKIVDSDGIELPNCYITIKISNRTYYRKSNGNGLIFLPINLRPGNYTAEINFNGTVSGYEKSSTTAKVVVLGYPTKIISNDIIKYYRNGTNLNGQLTVYNELLNTTSPLNDTFITLFVSGKNYYRTTDADGRFNLNINLKPGNYTVTISYRGYTGYLSSNKTVHVVVIPYVTRLTVNDLVKYYRNASRLEGNLYLIGDNGSETPFNNTYVNITVSSKTYNVRTNENGSFNLNINLNPKKYQAIINYAGRTGYLSSNKIINITVLSYTTKLVGNDLVKYYRNASRLEGNLYLIGDNGSETPFNNTYVNITVSSRTYNVCTDENGSFHLNINLNPGNYNATIKYNGRTGYSASNITLKINVLKINTYIISNLLIKYYRNTSRLIVHVSDQNGNSLSGAYINITVSGKTYSRRTNETGDANLTINLNVGNYTVDLYYSGSNGYSSSRSKVNITVIPVPVRIESLSADIPLNGTYYVRVVNNNGNPVNSAALVFTIRNRTYYRYTDSDGVASLTIRLRQGNYNMDVRPANDNYIGNNLLETISVG